MVLNVFFHNLLSSLIEKRFLVSTVSIQNFFIKTNVTIYYVRGVFGENLQQIRKTKKPTIVFNPIPAGVLENQDTLRGGQFDPPL